MPEEPHIPDEWTDAEQWAWKQIRAGRIADFHVRHKKELKPENPDGWEDESKDRRLSQAFLATVLTKESFRCATPFTGVRIEGAYFEEAIDLEYARLEQQLWLEKCRLHGTLNLIDLRVNGWFSLDGSWVGGTIDLNGAKLEGSVSLRRVQIEGDVDLISAKIGGQLYIDGSTFKGTLDMNGIEVGQSLHMSEKATFKEVDLTGAKIGGQLYMYGSTFKGTLDMNGIEVGRDLHMGEKVTFKEVDLTGAKIGGLLYMDGSTFKGTLDMGGIEVGQDLHMIKKATFKEVDLTGAKIGGQLTMDDSTFNGTLAMGGTEVGQDLFARSTKFLMDREVILYFARIGSNLDLSGATIRAIDLTGTTVVGELRLGSAKGQATNWVGASSMVLRNTTIGAIQDVEEIQDAEDKTDSWPKDLELEGFACRHLGGFGAEGTADIEKRRSKWFIDWLERDKTFSPQPYERFANLLREAGYPTKANDILYASRQRARRQARTRREWPRWLGMVLLEWTIGYGLGMRYFRATGWAALITAIGMFVFTESLRTPDEPAVWFAPVQSADSASVPSAAAASAQTNVRLDIYDLAWASFDQLLPIVTLDKKRHERLTTSRSLPSWAIYYFYVHKLVGWALGSVLVAGFAGLTQRR